MGSSQLKRRWSSVLAGIGLGALVGGLIFWSNRGFVGEANEPFRTEHIMTAPAGQTTASKLPLAVADVLQQGFTYLSQGRQSFVFESKDGQHVVKFLKSRRFEHRGRDGSRKRAWVHESWRMSVAEMAPETGVLYVHLEQLGAPLPVCRFVDPRGVEHCIPMDQVQFLIQKKARSFQAVLKELVSRQEEAGARQLIDQLMDWVQMHCDRGIRDGDRHLMRNVGLLEGKLVHMDVGLLHHDEKLRYDRAARRSLLLDQTRCLRRWLRKQSPELSRYLDEKVRYGELTAQTAVE